MPGPLPLDEQLCFSLYAATIAINRAYKPVLDRLGITYPQFLVLQVLSGAENGVPVGTIAEPDRLEQAGADFHQRARLYFLDLAAADPGRYLVLPARDPMHVIAERVRERVAALLSARGDRIES